MKGRSIQGKREELYWGENTDLSELEAIGWKGMEREEYEGLGRTRGKEEDVGGGERGGG